MRMTYLFDDSLLVRAEYVAEPIRGSAADKTMGICSDGIVHTYIYCIHKKEKKDMSMCAFCR